jgi:uncharacterized protein
MPRLMRIVAMVVGLTVCLLVLIGPDTLRTRRQQLFVHAAVKGNVLIMNVLLTLGADPTSNSTGGYPLYAAAWGGHLDALEFLVAHGADVNSVEQPGWTPTMIAASRGDDSMVRYLIAHGARVDAASSCGNALDIAVANNRPATAALLVAAGAVSSRNQ